MHVTYGGLIPACLATTYRAIEAVRVDVSRVTGSTVLYMRPILFVCWSRQRVENRRVRVVCLVERQKEQEEGDRMHARVECVRCSLSTLTFGAYRTNFACCSATIILAVVEVGGKLPESSSRSEVSSREPLLHDPSFLQRFDSTHL